MRAEPGPAAALFSTDLAVCKILVPHDRLLLPTFCIRANERRYGKTLPVSRPIIRDERCPNLPASTTLRNEHKEDALYILTLYFESRPIRSVAAVRHYGTRMLQFRLPAFNGNKV
jgi:hypothetical protein